uniref:Uncharacterized protein n=1 Tax=Candidatus Kentrum sp. MB TaxID=2138164 RepID=A0A450XKM0_9GAMM|nr:MAG: hypothetical protein BECKMB1821G_GA0114241_105415 [Candidatus Kentron sp. MB]VFK35806.1 MAG: hypothetical protein BECKMB1821I_GA0114274_11483 [Candidatus Kentron sp. MB]VFK76448.1 MAG: hypothetical protein BECKMB1821H_GA0114242_10576 [Candidatus Kentron sp. MB]
MKTNNQFDKRELLLQPIVEELLDNEQRGCDPQLRLFEIAFDEDAKAAARWLIPDGVDSKMTDTDLIRRHLEKLLSFPVSQNIALGIISAFIAASYKLEKDWE